MQNRNASARTVILFLLVVPLIGYMVYYGYRKNTESAERGAQCQRDCSAEGYLGHEFRWDVFSGPQCSCFSSDAL